LLEKRKEKRIKRIFASVAKADPFSFEYLLNKSTREKKLKGEKKKEKKDFLAIFY
jgi:hypothetical protein